MVPAPKQQALWERNYQLLDFKVPNFEAPQTDQSFVVAISGLNLAHWLFNVHHQNRAPNHRK